MSVVARASYWRGTGAATGRGGDGTRWTRRWTRMGAGRGRHRRTGTASSIIKVINAWRITRGVISTFSWGGNFFFIFQCHRTIEKFKKKNFICSYLTLFIVPFFLSFFLLVSLFYFFFFFLFFLFSFHFFFLLFLGATAPRPLN